MEEVLQVSESQAVQEPTSKNGSTEKSEKESNLELKTLQESSTQENGCHFNSKKAPGCDSSEIKMEVTKTTADSAAVEMQGKSKPHQNGPTENVKPPDSISHSKSPPKTEMQVTQPEKIVPKSEIQPVKSESSNSVSSKNGNVTTCGPFMSSIDAVINSVAHNIPPDELSDLDSNNSAKGTASDSRAVQSYDHFSHYMHQTNPKQTQVPQTNYGDRTVNQPYNPQMYPHMKGQTIPASANYGITNNPHHASASEQLSSLVKSHVLDTGSEHTPSDQQPSGHHPGIRPEMHPNIPPSVYNHQPMYRPMFDPNSGMPMHPPGPGDMHQQRAPSAHVRPENEIPSSQDTKQPRIPQKGGTKRQQRPHQLQQEMPQGMRPRMMPDQFNRGVRPMSMIDPRLMSTYFSPENIRMLQMRYPDPRMMPPQLLQQMQVFARMHQAQQQAQQQASRASHPPSSQPTGVSVAPGSQQQPQGLPSQSQASMIPSQPMSVEGSQPANSSALKQPHHPIPPHPGQPYPHVPLSHHPHEPGKQGLGPEFVTSRSNPMDMNSNSTNGTELQTQSGVQTALASTSAPHLPNDVMNRPLSSGRPPSGGRPPSAGRPPSVGRPPSANRPPSVGRPTSTEPPLNRPPSVSRPPSSNSRPPSADPSSRPSSVSRSPSTPQYEAVPTSFGYPVSSSEPTYSGTGMLNSHP